MADLFPTCTFLFVYISEKGKCPVRTQEYKYSTGTSNVQVLYIGLSTNKRFSYTQKRESVNGDETETPDCLSNYTNQGRPIEKYNRLKNTMN